MALWNIGSGRHQMTAHVEGRWPVAVYSSPERLARSLGVLYTYHQHTLKKEAPAAGETGKAAGALTDLKDRRGALLGGEAMEVLSTAGIPTVRGKLARNLEEAAEAAQNIGYPLTLKVVSPDIIHKTEAGGIRLNIQDRGG